MIPKMNPWVKEKWVNALLSGEYLRGEGCLAREVGDETEYCCLGVLSDCASKDGVADPPKISPSHSPSRILSWAGHEEYLSKNIAEWAGLDSDPRVSSVGARDIIEEAGFQLRIDTNDTTVPLSHLNDSRIPFYLIAKIIDKEL